MKKWIIILTTFIAMTVVHGQTNVYHTFPDSAIWRVDVSIYMPGNGGCQAYYYFQYYSSGDTLINSYNYKKIYKSFVYLTSTGPNSPCDPVPPWGYSGYVGALRDDSISKKAFFVFQNESNDSLLYDYNLNVGDTIKGCISINDVIVTSVDSIIIGSHERKKWNYSSTGFIIQGIGTDAGLIDIINTGGGTFSSLICVKDSSSTIFTSGHYSEMGCNLIYEELNEINSVNNVNCYPNPFYTETSLQTNKLFKNATLTIYNSYGQMVKQIDNLAGQTIIFQRDNLPSGLYFFRLTQDNKIIVTNELVITDK
jgi:hypothetical protein